MKNYQIQVNALISMNPKRIEALKERLEAAVSFALSQCELLDGVFVDIKEDK